jgi:hypothetical protein
MVPMDQVRKKEGKGREGDWDARMCETDHQSPFSFLAHKQPKAALALANTFVHQQAFLV